MNPDDIVFTVYNPHRDITFTLKEGSTETFGKQHIEREDKKLQGKMDAIKKAVEDSDVAYIDKRHSDRERIYCLGADDAKPNMYIKVITEYQTKQDANIITAWHTAEISPAEGEITYVKPRI